MTPQKSAYLPQLTTYSRSEVPCFRDVGHTKFDWTNLYCPFFTEN